jgi:hypothetical protein
MQQQNFKNHARLVPGFHFVTSGIILAALVIAIIQLVSEGLSLATVFSILVAICVALLFFYVRQFATGNQDRIIRAEENFRSYRLTGKLLNGRLTKAQIVALRFADDDEYPALAEKAVNENLSPSNIKKAIREWREDLHRI